jgi:uncharacterized membrane protein
VPGFGLLIALVVITVVGFLGRNLIGRSIVSYSESILHRTPLVRTLYKSLKQIFETVLKDQSTSFKKVGLIEFPGPGTWALVFISTEAQGEIAARLTTDGRELVAVFLPPTPVPTAGFLLFVPVDKIVMLDMTPEDAAKLLISGGLIAPPWSPALTEPPEAAPSFVSPIPSDPDAMPPSPPPQS